MNNGCQNASPTSHDEAARRYETVFGEAPASVADAPSRVNLLGEHTDYNDGFVLPTPLPPRTTVSVGPGIRAGSIVAFSEPLQETVERPIDDEPRGNWVDYLIGCLRFLNDKLGQETRFTDSLRVVVQSRVPIGAGVSSSAALEVAFLRALARWGQHALSDTEVALLARRAEVEYVGVPCGIMDQMVSSMGRLGFAMFIDARDQTHTMIPLPENAQFCVVFSGVAHRLTTGGYHQRQDECRRAARALGRSSLRDVTMLDIDSIRSLAAPLDRRVLHVLSENARVQEGARALQAEDLPWFGRVMNESHRSQRDDFEVSVPEVDRLVESTLRHGAIGARLTGGGFGGSVVALIDRQEISDVERWWDAIKTECPGSSRVV